MSDFITLQQASELSGKSLITIRRLVKELIESKDPEIKKVLKGGKLAENANVPYLIYREFLIEKLGLTNQTTTHEYSNAKVNTQQGEPMSSQMSKQNEQTTTHETTQDTGTSTHLSTQILQAKEETIAILKDQLKQKDEQIKQMLERDRERNLLFKNFQSALQIEAPKNPGAAEENSEVIVTDIPEVSNQKNNQKVITQEKKTTTQVTNHKAKSKQKSKELPKHFNKPAAPEKPQKKGFLKRIFG
ncbi:MAG: hypothetical protein ACR2LN_01090 [Candidatus Levyibacteriota bacterium]